MAKNGGKFWKKSFSNQWSIDNASTDSASSDDVHNSESILQNPNPDSSSNSKFT